MYNIYLFQIIFYLLLVLTITTFAKTDLNQAQVLKILYEAIDFQQNNNFEKAIEKYNYILQRYPNHPDALHLSGCHLIAFFLYAFLISSLFEFILISNTSYNVLFERDI